MADATSHLARDRTAARRAFVGTLDDLKAKAFALTDWRAHVRQRPLATVGVAIGAGIAVALLVPRMESGPDTGSGDGIPVEASALWRYVKGVLIAVAAAKAVETLGSVIPGFDDQFANEMDGELVRGTRRTDARGATFARAVVPGA